MFLSMAHGFSVLGNLTNSKMDKYLHCMESLSLEKPDLWYRTSRNWQLTKSLGKKKVHICRLCVFGLSNPSRKRPWSFQAPLRSLFIGPRHPQRTVTQRWLVCTMVRTEVFQFFWWPYHITFFSLWWMFNQFCFRMRAISCGIAYTIIIRGSEFSLFSFIRLYVFPHWPWVHSL
jgi:hypothetical protein